MAYAKDNYTGNGTTQNYSVSFPYITAAHVVVTLAGVVQAVTTDYTWLTSSTIRFVTAPANGALIDFTRNTSRDARLVDYQDGSVLNESTLDQDSLQAFYLMQEAYDAAGGAFNASASTNQWDALGLRIENVADAVAAQDAVTKAQLDAAIITGAGYVPSAGSITNTPAGNLAATDVQAALNELDARSGRKNAIINGNFSINQRVVAGSVVLAAGVYGHDRFKAGAAGCSYTFATSLNVTTITISAGSLQQVIEGVSLFSGTHTLSWVGTAQGKIGAGSYSASGVTGAAVGGTNLTVEFNTGTLSKVQFEQGSTASAFECRALQEELALCQRYYYKTFPQAVAPASNAGQAGSTAWIAVGASSGSYGCASFPATLRATPSIVTFNPAASGNEARDFSAGTSCGTPTATPSDSGVNFATTTSASSSLGNLICVHFTASAEL